MLARKVPKRAWQKLSAGAGAKGHRYDWAVIDLTDPRPGSRQLLIRRNRSTGETCLLPLPLACRSAADHPGARRRIKVAGRGVQ
jgi:hypothetical protein